MASAFCVGSVQFEADYSWWGRRVALVERSASRLHLAVLERLPCNCGLRGDGVDFRSRFVALDERSASRLKLPQTPILWASTQDLLSMTSAGDRASGPDSRRLP